MKNGDPNVIPRIYITMGLGVNHQLNDIEIAISMEVNGTIGDDYEYITSIVIMISHFLVLLSDSKL